MSEIEEDGLSFLFSQKEDAVRRPIIVDTANLLRAHSVKEKDADGEEALANALPAIEFARLMIENGFWPTFVIQPKYFVPASEDLRKRGVTEYAFLLNKMDELGLVLRSDAHTLDDHLMLAAAATTGGVVISNDRYNDHRDISKAVTDVIERRTVRFRMRPGTNHGEFHFKLLHSAPHDRLFYALPGDYDFETVKERHNVDWSEEKQRRVENELRKEYQKAISGAQSRRVAATFSTR